MVAQLVAVAWLVAVAFNVKRQTKQVSQLLNEIRNLIALQSM